MENLLLLVHRLPFPPTKGDKIRSWHLLERLRREYRVYLGTLVDDPQDWEHVPHVRSRCEDAYFAELRPGRAKVRSLRGFLTGGPLSLPYYHDRGLRTWVDRTLANVPISRILVFSSVMAQYLDGRDNARRRVVIDFVDVDSDKWRQYGSEKPWPMSWIYRREGRRLLAYERSVSRDSDASVFVSREEASLFADLAPECADRVVHVNNGIDTERFSPDAALPSPYPPGEPVVVFTGAMDYWANVDAVTWFAREVFPAVRERMPGARFYVVGARPLPAVRGLQSQSGVVVTGTVEDVRPYIAHARVAVAPLRIARGVQNKVLEALAMGKPVVATPAAMEGIEPWPEGSVMMTDDARALAEHVERLLGRIEAPVDRGVLRKWIANHYDWRRNLDAMVQLLEGEKVDSSGSLAGDDDRRTRVGMVG